MKDVLETLEGWNAEGLRFATATVVKTERSAPRGPGAVLAVSERGEVAGSVTGGCVEPAVYDEAQDILAGGPIAVREAKKLVRERPHGEKAAHVAAARRASDEGQDGLRAFLERRSPTWAD